MFPVKHRKKGKVSMMESIALAVERIREMEALFDALRALDPEDPALEAGMKKLLAYYEGGQWLRDYELDEQGLLPRDLKRGVLSQDGIDHLIWERNQA